MQQLALLAPLSALLVVPHVQQDAQHVQPLVGHVPLLVAQHVQLLVLLKLLVVLHAQLLKPLVVLHVQPLAQLVQPQSKIKF